MDRLNLATWGLALDDDNFARAAAGLAVLLPALDGDARLLSSQQIAEAAAARVGAEGSGIIACRWPEKIRDDWPLPTILAYAWVTFCGLVPAPRIAVVAAPSGSLRLAFGCRDIFARPQVEAGCVFVADTLEPVPRIDWRWPATIASLLGDAFGQRLAARLQPWSETWPFRTLTAGRDEAHAEILVVGGNLDDAMLRLLAARHRLRASLVIVAGLGGATADEAGPMLRALASRVAAAGIAVVSPRDSDQLADGVGALANNLSHNDPLDVALWKAFGADTLLLLAKKLPAASQIGNTVNALVDRLQNLPAGAQVTLSERSLERLQVVNYQGFAVASRVDDAGHSANREPEDRTVPSSGRGDSPLIFISYSLGRSNGLIQRLDDRLKRDLPHVALVLYGDYIHVGPGLIDEIKAQIRSSSVFLAFIEPDWTVAKEADGQRRVDFVEMQVAEAQQHNVRVIPVLVDGARKPPSAEVPGAIRGLLQYVVPELRGSARDHPSNELNSDIDRLAKAVIAAVRDAQRPSPPPPDEYEVFGPGRGPRMRGLGNPPRPPRQDLPMPAEFRAAPAPDVAESLAAAARAYRFDHESAEASAVSELAQRLREQELAAARAADIAAPRYLQQKSLRDDGGTPVEEHAGYVVGEPIMICLRIGPAGAIGWGSAPVPFPVEKLPQDAPSHTLQLVFFEPRQLDQPLTADIELPRAGISNEGRFVVVPRVAGAFNARVTVLHRGRVLQTAMLRTKVVDRRSDLLFGSIELGEEARVRHDWSDLSSRRRFDMALVLNHADGDAAAPGAGNPGATTVVRGRAWATDLTLIAEHVKLINAELSKVAMSTDDYGDGLDKGENPALLTLLAQQGSELYAKLYLTHFSHPGLRDGNVDVDSDEVTHIQVVSVRDDTVVPLEFVYRYPPPANGARVCPQFRDALASGHCPTGCARESDDQAHVCPMGFWGLRKVIERHVYDPAAAVPPRAEVVLEVEPAEGRTQLALDGGALLAHSSNVEEADVGPLLTSLQAHFRDSAQLVADWAAWKAAVAQRKPALIVAFPHNDVTSAQAQLEIGGKLLNTLRLRTDGYLRAPGASAPLVFLLGCDTAGTGELFANHVRNFHLAGAPIVVSTIATVIGEHAVPVGEKIVARLLRPDRQRPVRLGELIRDAKREALRDSLPMALCVVAFGDADWLV